MCRIFPPGLDERPITLRFAPQRGNLARAEVGAQMQRGVPQRGAEDETRDRARTRHGTGPELAPGVGPAIGKAGR
jgi:hypothetical protein